MTKLEHKSRLLILTRMFYELTDEEHPMTIAEIIEYLKTCGVSANEKTLRDDIKLIMDMGIDIVKVTSRPNRYFWG